mmetsp:Transcript_16400/g.20458  ORF Transcript_16400/g.20458 Transcript_16400/m.20458 type:complete len:208 (-) Transcript_16400:443-1066(-)
MPVEGQGVIKEVVFEQGFGREVGGPALEFEQVGVLGVVAHGGFPLEDFGPGGFVHVVVERDYGGDVGFGRVSQFVLSGEGVVEHLGAGVGPCIRTAGASLGNSTFHTLGRQRFSLLRGRKLIRHRRHLITRIDRLRVHIVFLHLRPRLSANGARRLRCGCFHYVASYGTRRRGGGCVSCGDSGILRCFLGSRCRVNVVVTARRFEEG